MNILFWVPYPTSGASNRYRVEQYLPYLKKSGINFTLRPFWSNSAFKLLYKDGRYFEKFHYFILGTLYRIFDIFFIFRYDFVFIHREAYPVGGAFFETLLVFLKKPFIFDFDDAIFLSFSSKPNNFIEKLRNLKKIPKVISMSSWVVAGNDYLADFARRHNSRVSMIPTSIDTKKYRPVQRNKDGKTTIGWIGSITTAHFLNSLRDVFVELSKRFSDNIEIRIVGADFSVQGLTNIVSKEWSLEKELDDLRSFDIGIMPLLDNEWTRGKCGFKAILYMGIGIPCVCSPVGVNKTIIADGQNGYLANSQQEWIAQLSALISDRALRDKIGREGRRTVEARYSIDAHVGEFMSILKKVHNER